MLQAIIFRMVTFGAAAAACRLILVSVEARSEAEAARADADKARAKAKKSKAKAKADASEARGEVEALRGALTLTRNALLKAQGALREQELLATYEECSKPGPRGGTFEEVSEEELNGG